MAKRKRRTAKDYLKLANKHLKKVQLAWDPPDWDDLSTYGLYCLEASVHAAVIKSGGTPERTHWGKVNQAKDLTKNHGLPDIEDLLKDLNQARKANAYGDEDFDESDFDAQDISDSIEDYFDKVSDFVNK